MNTRGLVELVILNAALDLGLCSPELFTMMVLMALITTFMTTPILSAMRIGRATATSERIATVDSQCFALLSHVYIPGYFPLAVAYRNSSAMGILTVARANTVQSNGLDVSGTGLSSIQQRATLAQQIRQATQEPLGI